MRRILTASLLFLILAFPASIAGVTEHCPSGGTKTNAVGDNLNDIVLDEGTEFCVKAANQASGTLEADGAQSLLDYVTWLNRGGQTPDVSYYVVYTTPEPSPTPTPTPTPSPTPTPVDETLPPTDTNGTPVNSTTNIIFVLAVLSALMFGAYQLRARR